MRVISFEGVAGAGKSTIAKMVKLYLESQGLNVYIHKPIRRVSIQEITKNFGEPDINIWTLKLPNIDYKVELFCFWSILMQENLSFKTSNYDVVIIDRYIDTITGLCFAKANKYNRKVNFDEYYHYICKYLYPQIIMPEKTFIFEINIDIASERTYNRERKKYSQEDKVLFNSIYNFNKKVAERESERFRFINSSLPINIVFEKIKNLLL